MTIVLVRPVAVGWKAHAALRMAGGVARVIAPLTASIFLDAGGEIVWLGRPDSLRHPRAMLAAGEPRIDGQTLRLDLAGLDPWRPPRPRHADVTALRSAACDLLALLRQPRADPVWPQGLGSLLAGVRPDFPLDRAVERVGEIAAACDRGDAQRVMVAAEPLLGLGPGLTPSGDDFVGGVLFARHAVAPPGSAWAQAASTIVARARDRTHPISAALLEDLAAGEGHEPLHDLVDALAQGAIEDAWAAVQQLGRLGHSSGWDMLAGVMVGLAGSAVLLPLGR